MWHRYWTKEIIFLINLILNSIIDFVDAGVVENERKMWVATHLPRIVRRDINKPSNVPPETFNSSELMGEEDIDRRNRTSSSNWDKLWNGVVTIFTGGNEEPRHETTDEHVLTVCFAIATTYMGALTDLRRYYSLRYFYANNLEFEIGYMTSEIIHKYQRMLEIYYIAQTYYFENQDKHLAPPTYMLYLYSNVLEMGTVIAHKCNMLEELEDKFKMLPQTAFGDYHLEKSAGSGNGTAEYEKILRNYQRKMVAEKKRRERQRRKLREKNLYLGYRPTTPQRKPSKGRHFPLAYGWSVEFF